MATVASLLGHRQMTFAVPCLRSLREACSDPIQLRLHDDGSLTADDLRILDRELAGPEVVSRTEADRRVEEVLAEYPLCAAFRRANPLALKLIDVPLWAAGDVLYCDADILFRRRFRGLFREPVPRAAFMRDHQNAYSVRPGHLLRHRTLRLAGEVNTGIVLAPRKICEIERIEEFLGLPDLRPAVWIEQTCWAALGAGQSDLLDSHQFAIASPEAIRGDAVALHFVSPVRSLLADCLPNSVVGEPIDVSRRPSRLCGPLSLLRDRLIRRWRR